MSAFGGNIILRDDAGNTYSYVPTTEGYRAAQRKIDELEHRGRMVYGDKERVYNVTQPFWREVGLL